MAFCTNCGNQVPDGIRFCTLCGAAMKEAVPAQPGQQAMQQAPQPAPIYAAPTATAYQEEPISTGGYIGIMFLMMLPFINLILLIIWACGGCKKVNKRNFARAMLVWMVIASLLGGLLFLVGGLFFGDTIDALKEYGTSITDIN
ncbi:zinc ribbon domain-containing protein [uncultured Bacteroides sp.]|uniref:zinc ribbon domain-containing protein n=1 Tax=uncultured Bacteroides sp. TaxID=162156 RepID=UPI0025CE228A|nr:zinc ribbon domain-containing protein [uncultured Bacteroides sp.]